MDSGSAEFMKTKRPTFTGRITSSLWFRQMAGVSCGANYATSPDEVFLTYFLGQVLSHCLLMRGIEPLHATAIVVDGGAVAFLGDSGDGKSTLAASFLNRGYSLITDDVLVLEFQNDTVLAHPSLPSIKLTPESADAIFNGRRAIPMNSFTSKMIFPLQESQHVRDLVRLRVVYVLPEVSKSIHKCRWRLFGRGFIPAIDPEYF